MNLTDIEVIVLDLQTTGPTPAKGFPLEVAWCHSRASSTDASTIRSYILEQSEVLPKRIQSLTGITADQLINAVSIGVAANSISEAARTMSRVALSDTNLERQFGVHAPICVIHFAQFERPFLHHYFPEVSESVDVLCTHQIATRLFPNLPSRGIRGLAGYFGLSITECKRAQTHVDATRLIWKNLCEILESRGIETAQQLHEWLSTTRPPKRSKYEYPLAPEKRLSLPQQPGIYKMLSCNNEVLYVGKATSLRDRVNSYFRGRKHKDPHKLEMLTRTTDIHVTPCATVLEACLLEVEEIQRIAPPYNIALKQPDRDLIYYSGDFKAVSAQQSIETPVGPFRSEMTMDSLIRLMLSIESGDFDPQIFFDDIDPELMNAGFSRFLERHELSVGQISGFRSLLALGLRFRRIMRETADELAAADDGTESPTAEEEDHELNEDDIADKFERLLLRSAHSYRQSKRLTRLLNSTVAFEEAGGRCGSLNVSHGVIAPVSDLVPDPIPGSVAGADAVVAPAVVAGSVSVSVSVSVATSPVRGLRPVPISDPPMKTDSHDTHGIEGTVFPWNSLTLNTYDRMRVLDTELQRLRSEGRTVDLHFA